MNNSKNLSFDEILIILFPISILLRSGILNIFMVGCGLYFLYKFYKDNIKINLKKNKWIILLIVLFIYSFINSFFSDQIKSSIISSLSIVKFLLFCLFISTVRLKEKNIKKLIFFISYILMFVSIDVFIQLIFGKDIFGFEIVQEGRLSGPFGDELIVGAYLTYLSVPIIAYFFFKLKDFKNYEKIYAILFIPTIFFSVLISGERMNFIILLSCYSLIIFKNFNLKKLIIFISTVSIIFSFVIFNNDGLRLKYHSFYEDIVGFNHSGHGRILSSSFDIWKENKIFGVGLKNYRAKCNINKFDNFTKKKNLCSTHPHNLYFELLTELGLIGILIFLSFLFFMIRQTVKNYHNSANEIKSLIFGSCLVILFYLWPLRSSGSFFSSFNGSFFWFNLGVILLLSNTKVEKIEK